MSCCGQREKLGDIRAEQRWDYINLSDFKSTTCYTPLSYGILYISLVISVLCYGVDLFTAINLLVFDRWSSQVKPVIPFNVSRWIFAACIILTWIFLVYRWWRAIRAMRSGVVVASYLDPLAVRVESVRVGKNGRGWRRFLVFAELTKSKKGADYVALFTYFSFEAWMRILFAEGPRQVINALTLWSVMQLNLLPNGKHAPTDGHNAIVQFFVNIQGLANENRQQTAILFSMLWTLVIWVFSALFLLIAVVMYVFFLWHHIPNDHGGLYGYCKIKIDKRLHKIVGVKVKKALTKNDIGADDGEGAGFRREIKRQPTIPILDVSMDDKLPNMPPLSRQGTEASFLTNSSRSNSRDDHTVLGIQRRAATPNVASDKNRPLPPLRSATQSSAQSYGSYASNAPLINEAGDMGYGPPGRPPPSRMASAQTMHSNRPPPNRSLTNNSQGTRRSYNPTWRPLISQSHQAHDAQQRVPPSRQNTGVSTYSTENPTTPTYLESRKPLPSRIQTLDNHNRSTPRPFPQEYEMRSKTPDSYGRSTPAPFPQDCETRPRNSDTYGRSTPAPLPQGYGTRSQTPTSKISRQPSNTAFVAFNPAIHPSSVPVTPAAYVQPPTRNFSAPHRPQNDYFSRPLPPPRSGTAPLPQRSGYEDVLDAYGSVELEAPARSDVLGRGGWGSVGGHGQGSWR